MEIRTKAGRAEIVSALQGIADRVDGRLEITEYDPRWLSVSLVHPALSLMVTLNGKRARQYPSPLLHWHSAAHPLNPDYFQSCNRYHGLKATDGFVDWEYALFHVEDIMRKAVGGEIFQQIGKPA